MTCPTCNDFGMVKSKTGIAHDTCPDCEKEATRKKEKK